MPFAVNDCLDVMRHAGYQRLVVLPDDFSDPNLLDCLPQVLSALRLLVCHLILHNSPQVLDWIDIWAVPGPFQQRNLVFSSGTLWLHLIGRERNVLFNDALNTFYLRLYGVRHMVKDHSDSEKGNPLPPHRLLFPINSKGSFICTIPQTG